MRPPIEPPFEIPPIITYAVPAFVLLILIEMIYVRVSKRGRYQFADCSERVMAVVALKVEYRGSVTEQKVRDFCRQHLPPYAVPKIVEFRDELPLTVSEKVFKKVLREQAIGRMGVKKEG